MMSWSGVVEWHVGVKFCSGIKSDFEFFVAHPFLHNNYCIHAILHSQPTHGCHYQDTNFKTPTTLCNLWSEVMGWIQDNTSTAKGF